MKKFVILFLSFLFIWWLCNADLAWYWINSYTSIFKLRSDWVLEVTENINVNFSENRHWIYRAIPYIYSNYLKTPIKNINVPWNNFITKTEWNNYIIQIWDANKTIKWKKNYSIQYQIKWSVREFTGYQELYWNMLWTEWDTPVNNFNFSLELPSDLDLKDDEIWVYIWEKWSSNTSKAIKNWNKIRNAEPLNLSARQWVTLAVRLPANYVPTKKYYSLKWWFIYHSKTISIWIRSIVSSLAGFFSIRELIRRYKRRKELRQTHWKKIRDIVYYTPPKWYTAMDVAAIYNWKSNFDILSAFLSSWVVDGYVKIEEQKRKILWLRESKNYFFKKTSLEPKFNFDESFNVWKYMHFSDPEERFWNLCFVKKDINKLDSFWVSESTLLKKIVDEVFYQIHTKFVPDWKELYKVKHISSKQYKYSKDKFYKKVSYWDGQYALNRFIAILWIFISCYLISIFSNNEFLFTYFTVWFRCIIFLYVFCLIIWNWISKCFSSRWNIKRDLKYISKEWIDAIEQTLWFRKYLLSVDDEKLRTLLKEDPTYFEKNLPYAVALDIWDHWIKKCMDILEEMDYSPKWISVSDNNWWNAITSMSSIWDSISSTVNHIDHPSSSGGSLWDWGSSSGWSSGGWFSWWWWGWGWWWSW